MERLLERYEDLRETYLSDEYLQNYIDETLEYLGPAIDRNFAGVGPYFHRLPRPDPGSTATRTALKRRWRS